MTKKMRNEIVVWMCKHWKNEDVFDDAVNHFGHDKEIIKFCGFIFKKINKALSNLPNYLLKEIKK